MKRLFILALILVLFAYKSPAQNGIRAFEAADSVGKVVTVTATVVSVSHKPHTKIISLGLSDFNSEQVVITYNIRVTRFTKSFYNR